ncbi:MAG: ion transporter, partial [Alphaproteobacteria bacterium]
MTHAAVLLLGIAAMILGTVPEIVATSGGALKAIAWLVLVFFAIEYGLRLILAPELGAASEVLSPGEARLRWATSKAGIIDLLAWLPILIALLAMHDQATARLFGAFWILKSGRHAPRLGLLGRVLRHAREPLLAVFVGFLAVLLVAATLAYLVEGPQQPELFGSIPKALWWAITTLTTTGYGDVVPVTALGRLLAGTVMVCGILVFALWAGILATEFAEEMRRHDFLRTWDLVAKVPYFE